MAQKRITLQNLRVLKSLTENQDKAIDAYEANKNLVLSGTAGTGKTFLAMSLGFTDVLSKTPYEQMVIIRSMVPTRDIGYLRGSVEEKMNAYTGPYRSICNELIKGVNDPYDTLIEQNKLVFESTSYIRGRTINDAVILVDEVQNLTFHELDSVITRVGQNCRIIFSGDYYQSDFKQEKDKKGLREFLAILREMRGFEVVEFGWEDIVRSDLVRDYIMTKEWLEAENRNGKTE